jgi:acetyltransferase-like isoleucine patch superfamily enzyme
LANSYKNSKKNEPVNLNAEEVIYDNFIKKVINKIISYFSYLPFINTDRNNTIRFSIFKNLLSRFLTDDERAKYYGFPKGCRLREGTKILNPENLKIGEYCWIGENSMLDASGGLIIGSHTSIGLSVFVWSHSSHITNLEENNIIGSKSIIRSTTKIGSGCFIAGPSVIAPGVTIGDKVFIKPFSTITKDIPERSIVDSNHIKSGVLTDKMIQRLKNKEL